METAKPTSPAPTHFKQTMFMRDFGNEKMREHLEYSIQRDLKEKIHQLIDQYLHDGRHWSVRITTERSQEEAIDGFFQDVVSMQAELFLIDPREAEVGEFVLGMSIAYDGRVYSLPCPLKNGEQDEAYENHYFIRQGKHWQRTS